MFIPDPACALSTFLHKRDAVSTAESFKSWNTCMNNHVCKIVAIVGIVIAALIVLWLVISILRCVCMGIDCLYSCCFCCGNGRGSRQTYGDISYPQQNYQGPPPQFTPGYQHQPYMANRGMNDFNYGHVEEMDFSDKKPAGHTAWSNSNGGDYSQVNTKYAGIEMDHYGSDPHYNRRNF